MKRKYTYLSNLYTGYILQRNLSIFVRIKEKKNTWTTENLKEYLKKKNSLR